MIMIHLATNSFHRFHKVLQTYPEDLSLFDTGENNTLELKTKLSENGQELLFWLLTFDIVDKEIHFVKHFKKDL